MLSIHPTYDRGRLEKLSGMFQGDPRQGNMTLYVREHFDLKRICEHCGKRTTANRLAVASVVIEGPSWVLPISLQHDGQIVVDLETAIPNQSNFLSTPITEALIELGITFTHDEPEYLIAIMPHRDAHYQNVSQNAHQKYADARAHLECRVITNASPDDVLRWDTEVEYDYEKYCEASGEERTSGYNVQTEYFQWLAEHQQLVVARLSDKHDRTLGLAYCVPERYHLCLMRYKWRLDEPEEKYGLRNALLFTLVDHVYDKELATPLNLGSNLESFMDVWKPIPVVKQRLEISNRVARQAILDCFGSK